MKKLVSIMLAFILVMTSVTFSDISRVNAENSWQNTAITAPQEGKLVGAGYINIVFEPIENAAQYEVYFDGQSAGIHAADDSALPIKHEVYTTGVTAHTAYIVATLEDGSQIQTDTRTFYVSKKGLAMGGDMSSAVSMKKLNISWYYNWAITAFNSSVDEGVAHVPMLWGASEENLAGLADITDDSNYILGYNEPDIESQANISPAEGLKAWRAVEALGRRTVSPASANPNGDIEWVSKFLEGDYDSEGVFVEGTDCDAIGIHSYGASTNLTRLLDAVDKVWNTYHKPIWVTEVSVMGRKGTSYDNSYENVEVRKKVEEYVEKLVGELDKRDYVERYSWFPYNINSTNEIDDMDGSGASAMFDYDTGKFTNLGIIYSTIGNPAGYHAEVISDEEKYETPTTPPPTTLPTTGNEVQSTTQAPAPTTTAQNENPEPKAKKPAKVTLKKPKNIKKLSVKLSWKKAANAKKYQIQYSLNKKFKKAKKFATKQISTNKITYKIKKLKKKTYYFRVRGVNGKQYGPWSKVQKIKVKK